MSKNQPIIFDNGSGYFKAGFAEDFSCSVYLPTVVGTPKSTNLMIGMDQKDFFVGHEAYQKRNVLNLVHPVQNGIIQDWEKIKQIWEYTYEHELIVDPSENPLLITEPPNSDKSVKQKMAEIFFEDLKGEHFYTSVTSVLALYASGKTTGLVLESGEGITHSVPVYEGFALPFATIKLDIGGRDLTQYLIDMLKKTVDQDLSHESYFQTFQKVKEKNCYIAFDFDSSIKENQKNTKKQFGASLPDGTEIFLTDQTFRCPEILFQPNKINKDFCGIHEAIFQAILRCNQAIRKELYSCILLAGGNTMFPGINNRLFKEISALAPATMQIKTKAPQERKNSVWIGGSILCSLSSFNQMWITDKEYKEQGDSIFYRKIL